jgi:hypothetical protein
MSAELLLDARSHEDSGGSQGSLSPTLALRLIDRISSLERRIADQQLTTNNALAGVLQQQVCSLA